MAAAAKNGHAYVQPWLLAKVNNDFAGIQAQNKGNSAAVEFTHNSTGVKASPSSEQGESYDYRPTYGPGTEVFHYSHGFTYDTTFVLTYKNEHSGKLPVNVGVALSETKNMRFDHAEPGTKVIEYSPGKFEWTVRFGETSEVCFMKIDENLPANMDNYMLEFRAVPTTPPQPHHIFVADGVHLECATVYHGGREWSDMITLHNDRTYAVLVGLDFANCPKGRTFVDDGTRFKIVRARGRGKVDVGELLADWKEEGINVKPELIRPHDETSDPQVIEVAPGIQTSTVFEYGPKSIKPINRQVTMKVSVPDHVLDIAFPGTEVKPRRVCITKQQGSLLIPEFRQAGMKDAIIKVHKLVDVTNAISELENAGLELIMKCPANEAYGTFDLLLRRQKNEKFLDATINVSLSVDAGSKLKQVQNVESKASNSLDVVFNDGEMMEKMAGRVVLRRVNDPDYKLAVYAKVEKKVNPLARLKLKRDGGMSSSSSSTLAAKTNNDVKQQPPTDKANFGKALLREATNPSLTSVKSNNNIAPAITSANKANTAASTPIGATGSSRGLAILQRQLSGEMAKKGSNNNSPCSNYKVKIGGKIYGECVCGFPRNAHQENE